MGTPRAWLDVRLRRPASGWKLEVTDSEHRKHLVPWDGREALLALVHAELERFQPNAPAGDRVVPVFWHPQKRASKLGPSLHRVLRPFVRERQAHLIEATPQPTARQPFELPLDVVAVGTAAEYMTAGVERLRYRWPSTDLVRLHSLTPDAYLRGSESPDVVVVDARTAKRILRKTTAGVHLIFGTHRELATLSLPRTVSAILIPPANNERVARQFVSRFFDALLGNRPVDLAVAEALSARTLQKYQPRLVLDPQSNWAVSMRDAVSAARQSFMDALQVVPPFERRPYVNFQGARYLTSGFYLGDDAFVRYPLELVAIREDILRSSHHTESERPRPARSLDVVLERLSAVPSWVDDVDPMSVNRKTVLKAGALYSLQIELGRARIGSLFEERPYGGEAILPRHPSGRLIDITVFGLDFDVESKPILQRRLPECGAIDVAKFRVRAPTPWKSGRKARLRVTVSYLDQVLQSHVLTATVGDEERRTEEDSIAIALEHAATASFDNLESLKSRSAYFILNDDPLPTTHTLAMKAGNDPLSMIFDHKELAELMEWFRAIMHMAAGSGDSPRFPQPIPHDRRAELRADFDAVIRQLAHFGSEAHNRIFAQTRYDAAMASMVQGLRTISDVTLHIVQRASNAAIAWPAIYDFALSIDELKQLPVCNGFIDGGRPCPHDHTTNDALCVRGFWGVRHVIEVVVARGHKVDVPTRVICPTPKREMLSSFRGKRVRNATEENIYEKLWPDVNRTPVVLVQGHLDADAQTHLVSIDLSPATLTSYELGRRTFRDNRWADPCSLVLLLACNSTATPPNGLLGFAESFASAGASGMVGTEERIYSDFADEVGTQLAAALQTSPRTPLGRAVRDVRVALLREGSPLGFTLTAYGSADLIVEGDAE